MYHGNYPHRLSQDEALARIQALTAFWDAKYDTRTEWTGYRGTISGRVLGLSFSSWFQVDPDRIFGELKVSVIAVKMGGKRYLKRKMDHYMNPAIPLEELRALIPRAGSRQEHLAAS
jgi:hypothetical protein